MSIAEMIAAALLFGLAFVFPAVMLWQHSRAVSLIIVALGVGVFGLLVPREFGLEVEVGLVGAVLGLGGAAVLLLVGLWYLPRGLRNVWRMFRAQR